MGHVEQVALDWAGGRVSWAVLPSPRTVSILGVAGRLSGTVSPFRAEQGSSLETPSRARPLSGLQGVKPPVELERGLGIALQAIQEEKALSSQ